MTIEAQAVEQPTEPRRWTNLDVIAYILARAGVSPLTSDRWKLQRMFQELKEKATGHETELLADLVFATRDVIPFSRELENALAYLGLAGLVITENPTFRKLRIDIDQAAEVTREAHEIFDEDDLFALDALASRFAGLARAPEHGVQ